MAESENARRVSSGVRRPVEARLVEVEGVATIGLLLEAAIHGINNPLASLLVGLEQLGDRMRHLPLTEDHLDVLRLAEEARAEGQRVAMAVRQLTTLLPTDKPGAVDVNDVLLRVFLLFEEQLGPRLRVAKSMGPIQAVVGREARIAQVFSSCASLCIDVMDRERPDAPVSVSVVSAEENSQAIVSFALPDAVPGASGLLAAAYARRVELLRSMTQQSGGTLHVAANGMRLVLPAAAVSYDSEAEVSLKRRESAPPRGELRILVVDDEPSIRRALERGLHDVGCIQSVRSGNSALELLDGGAMFDVILSDLVMAEGTGIDLANWLARHRPRLKRRLILMTGMGETHTDSHPDVMTVPKPFDLVALRELVCLVSARA